MYFANRIHIVINARMQIVITNPSPHLPTLLTRLLLAYFIYAVPQMLKTGPMTQYLWKRDLVTCSTHVLLRLILNTNCK